MPEANVSRAQVETSKAGEWIDRQPQNIMPLESPFFGGGM